VALSLLVVCIAGSTALTAGASASGGKKTKAVRIAHLTAVVQNSYFQALFQKEKAVATKMNATIQLFDANFDANKQVAQCQDALASGKFDAIIILPVDNAAVVPCVKSAIKKGIKVVSHNFPLGPSFSTPKVQIKGQSGSVERVTTLDGKARGQMIVQACRGINPCQVAIIEGNLTTTYGQVRMKATLQVLKSHPNIQVVLQAQGGFVRADSLKVTQDALVAHPALNVVATGGDQGGLGAQQALQSAGKKVGIKPGEVRIIGVGTSAPGVAAVKAGLWWGTTTWLPFVEGSLIAKIAIEAVRGQLKKPIGVDEAAYGHLPQYYSNATMKKFPKNFVGQWPG
jgi:ribose transport system substrate-binding protein